MELARAMVDGNSSVEHLQAELTPGVGLMVKESQMVAQKQLEEMQQMQERLRAMTTGEGGVAGGGVGEVIDMQERVNVMNVEQQQNLLLTNQVMAQQMQQQQSQLQSQQAMIEQMQKQMVEQMKNP